MYTDFFFKWQVIPVEILKTTKMCKKKKKENPNIGTVNMPGCFFFATYI